MKTIFVSNAPQAIGPYAHATKVGNLVFCSGQTPLDPQTMILVEGNIKLQTRRALENLRIVLEGVGLSLGDVVKTTVFLRDMADFQGMNEIYAQVFSPHTPARTTVAVKQNPLDALVEIECIAAVPDL